MIQLDLFNELKPGDTVIHLNGQKYTVKQNMGELCSVYSGRILTGGCRVKYMPEVFIVKTSSLMKYDTTRSN